MMETIRRRLFNVTTAVVAGLLVLAVMSAVWNHYNPPAPPAKTFTPAHPMGAAVGILKVDKPAPPSIKVIPKRALAQRVELPPEVLDDPGVEVTATGTAPPSEGGSSIITTIDGAGDTKILVRDNPVPFFSFPSDVEVMARGGISTRGRPVVDLAGRWQFLRVGRAKVGAYLEGSVEDPGAPAQKTAGKVMIETSMKFN